MKARYLIAMLAVISFGFLSFAGADNRSTEPSDRFKSLSIRSMTFNDNGKFNEDEEEDIAFCTRTAHSAHKACRAEVKDDFWIAMGNCINISDAEERQECEADAYEERKEGYESCKEQFEARLEVCDLIGEERYDPDFDPANFVHPDEIGDTIEPNPYFPLVPGAQWVYEGGGERITDTVTDETKLIEGVTCRVVRDVVEEIEENGKRDGVLIELTDDWYAQDIWGNVWYCGEIAQEFETFEGDDPEEPELVDIEGSWKTGRDGAKPGILMLADPQVGDAYREEVSLGDAEDVAEVISISGTTEVPAPSASCENECLVTLNFTAIEPDVIEIKYYKPGVGLILEEEEDGTQIELVEYTMP